MIIDNNNLAPATFYNTYTQISSGPIDTTNLFDQIQLKRRANLQLAAHSTFTITAATSPITDGTTCYIRVDGNLVLPSSFTLSGSMVSFSRA